MRLLYYICELPSTNQRQVSTNSEVGGGKLSFRRRAGLEVKDGGQERRSYRGDAVADRLCVLPRYHHVRTPLRMSAK